MKHSKNLLFSLFLIVAIGFASCGNQKIVSSIQTNAIKVMHIPEGSPNGESWDPFGSGLPDVQLKISNESGILYSSETYDDASSKNIYMFKGKNPFMFTDLNTEYRIDVYDIDDLSADEWLGGFKFTPADFKDQKEILLTSSTTPIEITLLVDWNYIKKKDASKPSE